MTVLSIACDRDATSPATQAADVESLFRAAAQPKTDLCHRTEGTNEHVRISVADPAVDTHIAHGDARVGEPVPGQEGMVFDDDCTPVPCDCTLTDPSNGALDALLFTGPGLGAFVSDVHVLVEENVIDPAHIGASFLDIEITSQNGVFQEHGSATIPVTDGTALDELGGLATVRIDWGNRDTHPRVLGAVYTVCTVLRCGDSAGPRRCDTFP